jgi:formate hydrogenlyase subunit 4
VGGRKGPGLLQSGWDLLRLLRKRPVYSTVARRCFAPAPGWCWRVAAGGADRADAGAFAPLQFAHDFVVFAYTLGLARCS